MTVQELQEAINVYLKRPNTSASDKVRISTGHTIATQKSYMDVEFARFCGHSETPCFDIQQPIKILGEI